MISKRSALLALGLAAFGTLSQLAPAQITRQGNGYLFRLKWTQGQTLNYGIGVRLTPPQGQQGGQPMNMQTGVSMRVVRVANGRATVDVTPRPTTMNGRPQQMPNAQKQTITVDNRGQAQGNAAFQNIAGTMPANPIRVGGTWTGSVPVAGVGMPGQVTGTYRFVRVVNRNGRQLAEIAVTMSGMMSGKGTMFLDMADGHARSASMNMTMTMPGAPAGQGKAPTTMRIPMSITMTRQ